MNHGSDPHVELLDDAMHAQAVADRAQRRRIGEADAQDATFAASLRAAAERATPVLLETVVGQPVRGVITVVAEDHVEVTGRAVRTLVQLAAVIGMRGQPGVAPHTAAPTTAASRGRLVDVLAELAHDRGAVELHRATGDVLRGTVESVGRDLIVVRSLSTADRVLVPLHHAHVVSVERA